MYVYALCMPSLDMNHARTHSFTYTYQHIGTHKRAHTPTPTQIKRPNWSTNSLFVWMYRTDECVNVSKMRERKNHKNRLVAHTQNTWPHQYSLYIGQNQFVIRFRCCRRRRRRHRSHCCCWLATRHFIPVHNILVNQFVVFFLFGSLFWFRIQLGYWKVSMRCELKIDKIIVEQNLSENHIEPNWDWALVWREWNHSESELCLLTVCMRPNWTV